MYFGDTALVFFLIPVALVAALETPFGGKIRGMAPPIFMGASVVLIFWMASRYPIGVIEPISNGVKIMDFTGYYYVFRYLMVACFILYSATYLLSIKRIDNAVVDIYERVRGQKCPKCAERIKRDATKCRYCGHEMT